jgi:hypothetical protein
MNCELCVVLCCWPLTAGRQAECLQSWCDLQRELLQQAPDEVLAQQGHTQQVTQAVVDAYRASLEAYKQVRRNRTTYLRLVHT